MSKRKLNRRQRWRIQKIQQEKVQRAHKRDLDSETLLSSGELGPEQEGLVIAHYGTQLAIEALGDNRDSDQSQRCYVRANVEELVTGDKVIFHPGADTGVVVARQPRHSELQRPDKYNNLKTIAANIDNIIIVIAPEPKFHHNLLDRYLVAAEASGIAATILLNKTDKLDDVADFITQEKLDLYKALGYPLICSSSLSDDNNGLQQLKRSLIHKISVFVGQSGVGKSSLVNALLPEAALKTGTLSDSGQGNHTTTTAQLFHFADGGSLIDSPGIREFELWHLPGEELINHFVEFRPYLGYCKFRNCSHQQEPGCALHAAIQTGVISEERFASYQHILNSLPAPRY